ncbi:MAG: hypothetical protein AVDCRST_MAG89-1884, partial [uncultured Gemmatimonadetes bacterium]
GNAGQGRPAGPGSHRANAHPARSPAGRRPGHEARGRPGDGLAAGAGRAGDRRVRPGRAAGQGGGRAELRAGAGRHGHRLLHARTADAGAADRRRASRDRAVPEARDGARALHPADAGRARAAHAAVRLHRGDGTRQRAVRGRVLQPANLHRAFAGAGRHGRARAEGPGAVPAAHRRRPAVGAAHPFRRGAPRVQDPAHPPAEGVDPLRISRRRPPAAVGRVRGRGQHLSLHPRAAGQIGRNHTGLRRAAD